MFDRDHARFATARLVAAYGDHRVCDDDMRTLWLTEFVEAFKGFEAHRVMHAMGPVIRRCKFWPSIAEIMQEVRGTVQPPTLPVFREPRPVAITPEESERRKEVVARIKREHRWDERMACELRGHDDLDVPLEEHIRVLSERTPGISDALRSVMKKRAR